MKEPEKPEQSLYWAVGHALTEWNFVESELQALLEKAVAGPAGERSPYVGLLYWAIVSFTARRNAIDTIVKELASGSEALLSEWKKLEAKVKRAAQQRDEIAHGSVVGTNIGVRFFPSYQKKTHLVVSFPSPENDKAFINFDSTGLTFDQVEDRANSFRELRIQIRDFSDELNKLGK